MAGTIVNPTTISAFDGNTNPNNLFGKAGEDIVAELHGKYYTQAYRGEMFYASQIAGTVATIYSQTTITGFGIWNQSTNKNIIPVRMIVGETTLSSAGTPTIGFVIQKNVGYQPATGSQVLTYTQVAGLAPQNCNTGSGVTSQASIGTGGTLTTAPTLSQYVGLIASSAVPLTVGSSTYPNIYDFDGMFCWAPGTLVTLGTAIADTGVYAVTLFWYEAPL